MSRFLLIGLLFAAALPSCAAPAADRPAREDSTRTESPKTESAREIGSADWVLQPQDLIRIQIYKEPDLSGERRISQEGTIELALVGRVELRNKTLRQAEALIRSLYDKDYLVNPQVSLIVLEYAPRSVEVFGMVQTPGVVYFPKEEGMTLTGAISRAGSFTRLANKRAVTIRRTMPDGKVETLGPINVEDLTKGGATNTWPLQQGDVINVPEKIL